MGLVSSEALLTSDAVILSSLLGSKILPVSLEGNKYGYRIDFWVRNPSGDWAGPFSKESGYDSICPLPPWGAVRIKNPVVPFEYRISFVDSEGNDLSSNFINMRQLDLMAGFPTILTESGGTWHLVEDARTSVISSSEMQIRRIAVALQRDRLIASGFLDNPAVLQASWKTINNMGRSGLHVNVGDNGRVKRSNKSRTLKQTSGRSSTSEQDLTFSSDSMGLYHDGESTDASIYGDIDANIIPRQLEDPIDANWDPSWLDRTIDANSTSSNGQQRSDRRKSFAESGLGTDASSKPYNSQTQVSESEKTQSLTTSMKTQSSGTKTRGKAVQGTKTSPVSTSTQLTTLLSNMKTGETIILDPGAKNIISYLVPRVDGCLGDLALARRSEATYLLYCVDDFIGQPSAHTTIDFPIGDFVVSVIRSRKLTMTGPDSVDDDD